MMQRRPEFSFPGSPARGLDRALPPRPPENMVPPRPGQEEEIRWLQASRQGSPDYCSSGTPSPPLWAHHNHDHQHHRPYPASAGSSPSRAQAIAEYRREMLDLVRGLPESAYELSLRDIVEHPSSSMSSPLPTPPPPPPSKAERADAAVRGHEPANTAVAGTAEEQAPKQRSAKGQRQGRKERAVRRQRSRSLERSVSLDTGLLIKFFLPLSIRGGKKKVSPKPDATAKDGKKKKKQGTKREEARQDEEWWTKSEFSEAGSSSRTSSTGSSNSNSNSSTGSIRNGQGNGGSSNARAPVRSRSRKINGCYAFFRAHKSKNGVSQD